MCTRTLILIKATQTKMASSSPIQLLGPPEIHFSNTQNPTTSWDPFVELMVSNFNKAQVTVKPPKGLTENGSPTFLSTGNPCLDFFFHVVPDTSPEDLTHRLDLAWKHDPLIALKLICNLRGVRGTGKSDKQGFYRAALWLHEHHPKTLASNVRWFAEFGYFKDLPEILYRLVGGADVRNGKEKQRRKAKRTRKQNKDKSEIPREERVAMAKKKIEIQKAKAKEVRDQKNISIARKAVEKYVSDLNYRMLYDRISEVFAVLLVLDLGFLKEKRLNMISLAAKWCPSLDSSFDRATLLCESIAKRVFPRELYPEYLGIEEAHYGYRVRDRLRKEVLVPLRQALEIPEVYMSSKKWNLLPYNRVPSVAMKAYKKIFKKHDGTRFGEYLEDVESGKAKIAAGALLPHEIVASLKEEGGSQVAELQWRRMVDDLSRKGKFSNCLPICDVSGSMNGTPMEVCIALGLLLSELSEMPWKGKVITFSQNPQLHVIQGDSLAVKTEFVRKMEWGFNTDFQKVFNMILQVAVEGRLSEEDMVKRVFVFSDMEFDQASPNDWETDYQAIKRKFGERGYRNVPEMVFWNLRASKATPVPSDQKGVALVSGFSKNLLGLFLNGDGVVSPLDAMEVAISGQEYQELVVID